MKNRFHTFNIHRSSSMSRRRFLKRTGMAGLGMSGLASTVANMSLVGKATADPGGGSMSDYKALICLFLSGGCDSNNLLIPINDHPGRANYDADRQFVAVPEADITTAGTTLNVKEVNGTTYPTNVYGLHPSCQFMANRFNGGQLAMIANCGTLAVPIAPGISKDDYDQLVKPIQLFSHSDQVNEWFSSIPQNPFISGWAGRIADMFQKEPYLGQGINADSVSSMLMTAAGQTDLLVAPGGSVPQYAVSTSGAVSFAGYGTNYGSGLSGGVYRNNDTGRRLNAFEGMMNFEHDHIIEQGFNDVMKSARENEETIGAATAEADAIPTPVGINAPTGNHLDDIFLNVYNDRVGASLTSTSRLPRDIRELLMICKMIAGRECLGNNRQVFFFNKGGFDTHADINANLPVLLTEVDIMVECYMQAMQAIADAQPDFDPNMATLFEGSDFNRTWTPNTSGTDHAWGTHVFCCGGAVEEAIAPGGSPTDLKIHGLFPELAVNGADDVPGNNNRGRWVPQISTDQYYGRLAKWFGVSSADLATIFPNLNNGFSDPLGMPELDFLSLT